MKVKGGKKRRKRRREEKKEETRMKGHTDMIHWKPERIKLFSFEHLRRRTKRGRIQRERERERNHTEKGRRNKGDKKRDIDRT